MKRIFSYLALMAMLIGTHATSTSAQMSSDARFSNTILPTYGYQTLRIQAEPDGFVAPDEITAGPTHVTLTSLPETFTYAAFMQPAAGLTMEEATEMALLSARDDISHEGWIYGGGSYAENGGEVSFVVDLQPGEWQIAASYQNGPDAEEIMTLYPLTVTAADTSASGPTADVTIELNDTEFNLPDGNVDAGPQVYEVTNVGDAPRQLVLVKSPRELTVEDFAQWFASFDSATPAPDVMSQMIWVGYAAILSPGQSVWLELDLEPGTYATTSWVIDPESGMPALLLGMVDNFTVA